MSGEKLTKTCLRIDEKVWKQFKIMCINQGVSANEQLTNMVHDKLKQHERSLTGEGK